MTDTVRTGNMTINASPALLAALASGGLPRRQYVSWGVGSVLTLALLFAVIVGAGFVAYNGGIFYCDSNCWEARRAIANSAANASAGFGNNDSILGQTAVAPAPRVPPVVNAAVPAPVVNVIPPPVSTTVTVPPQDLAIRYTGKTCHRREDPPGIRSGREGYGPGPNGEPVLGCWKY